MCIDQNHCCLRGENGLIISIQSEIRSQKITSKFKTFNAKMDIENDEKVCKSRWTHGTCHMQTIKMNVGVLVFG